MSSNTESQPVKKLINDLLANPEQNNIQSVTMSSNTTAGIIILSNLEYKRAIQSQKKWYVALICPWHFTDSTRRFDMDYIKKECGINKSDIKKVLTMTYKNKQYINVQNKLVKYNTEVCCDSKDDGAYQSHFNPMIWMNVHPTSHVVIVVKDGSKYLENREARCPSYWESDDDDDDDDA
jgi:hypothetical protein